MPSSCCSSLPLYPSSSESVRGGLVPESTSALSDKPSPSVSAAPGFVPSWASSVSLSPSPSLFYQRLPFIIFMVKSKRYGEGNWFNGPRHIKTMTLAEYTPVTALFWIPPEGENCHKEATREFVAPSDRSTHVQRGPSETALLRAQWVLVFNPGVAVHRALRLLILTRSWPHTHLDHRRRYQDPSRCKPSCLGQRCPRRQVARQ